MKLGPSAVESSHLGLVAFLLYIVIARLSKTRPCQKFDGKREPVGSCQKKKWTSGGVSLMLQAN